MPDSTPSRNIQFHFISVQDGNSQIARRRARSHAVTRGLQNKRTIQQTLGNNFRVVSSKEQSQQKPKKRESESKILRPLICPSTDCVGAVEMLTAESSTLRAWLERPQNQQTVNPVFSVPDELVLLNFRSVLQRGINDYALLSAIMLTFLSAASGHSSMKVLQYQSQAMSAIRLNMSSSKQSTAESTLGAILLLACVEVCEACVRGIQRFLSVDLDVLMSFQARIGIPRQVQLHMGAILELLHICQKERVYLSDNLKRAIFWSDLNCSVMTGSTRVVDHTTFAEFEWKRDPDSPQSYTLPSGFLPYSHILDDEFVEIIKDISALQCIRDSVPLGREDTISMADIDNHQASIQSRLVTLSRNSTLSDCCHIAAYLCSTMLRCRVWRTSTLPSHLSLKLLRYLEEIVEDATCEDNLDLLIWLIYIGGAFSPAGAVRAGYITLLYPDSKPRFGSLFRSWTTLLKLLRRFIWSDEAFMAQTKHFWEETQAFNQDMHT